MNNRCKNCGSKLQFNPKDKGCKCVNCGSIFPIKYKLNNAKYDFSNADNLNLKANNQVKSFRCSTCGAIIVVDKNEIKSNCAYCGNTEISQIGENKMMNINSVIPFEFNKTDALTVFNSHVKDSVFVNKKVLNVITTKNIEGVYVNAFIFDLDISAYYNGVLSYTKTYKDSKGNYKTETIRRHVSGVIHSNYNNLTIESSSHLNQYELHQIMPFDNAKAVEFKPEFSYGYAFEYHDEQFGKCFDNAKQLVIADVKRKILKKHQCETIESLNLGIDYLDKKYNYSLLPVYFINKKYKNKNYHILMNGQTGKLSKLPKSTGKILLLVFSILLGIGLIALIIALLTML